MQRMRTINIATIFIHVIFDTISFNFIIIIIDCLHVRQGYVHGMSEYYLGVPTMHSYTIHILQIIALVKGIVRLRCCRVNTYFKLNYIFTR